MQIPVIDPNFMPMGQITKSQLNLHEQVTITEGNNVPVGNSDNAIAA